MSDRKEQALERKLAARHFDDAEVMAALDEVDEASLVYRFGNPVVTTHYAAVPGWAQGDRRPSLASEDPAVMAAIGRCATWRSRLALRVGAVPGHVHPTECGWCGYPLEQLVAACSWGVWLSRHVLSEVVVWVGDSGSSYARRGRSDIYEHPAWAAFAELSRDERAARVQAAVEASRS